MSIQSGYKYDVLIIGAGPAGSSSAIRLAQSGLSVALIEQKKFPRNKLCGEFISPECLAHFADLNVLNELSIIGVNLDRTVFYARNGRSVAVPSKWLAANSYALGLSRAAMDHQLLKRARSAGVDVLEETSAAGLVLDGNKVSGARLKNKDRGLLEVRSTLIIDATGRARILTNEIERSGPKKQRRRADFVAFKAHLKGADIPQGVCEIYAYRGGYGGCSSVENNRHNICFIVSTAIAKEYSGNAVEIMRNVISMNHRAAHSLCGAEVIDDWLAVPIENYGRASLAPAEGLLTVGDAAAFIDPFTGSGILLALESSKVAASVITDGLASRSSFAEIAREYRQRYSIAFDRRLLISSLVRRAAFVPFLAETVIKVLALSSRLTFHLAKATRPAARIT